MIDIERTYDVLRAINGHSAKGELMRAWRIRITQDLNWFYPLQLDPFDLLCEVFDRTGAVIDNHRAVKEFGYQEMPEVFALWRVFIKLRAAQATRDLLYTEQRFKVIRV